VSALAKNAQATMKKTGTLCRDPGLLGVIKLFMDLKS